MANELVAMADTKSSGISLSVSGRQMVSVCETEANGSFDLQNTMKVGSRKFMQKAHYDLSKHKLAAVHMNARQFYLFTIPISFITMISGIIAFAATTELAGQYANYFNLVVGSLAFFLVFLQTLSTHLQYDVRGEMHAGTTVDLRDLRNDLDIIVEKANLFGSIAKKGGVAAIEDSDGNGIDDAVEQAFDGIQKQYNQCLKGCKSVVPLRIGIAFRSLSSRLDLMNKTADYDADSHAILYFQACDDLAASIVGSRGWPIKVPEPTYLVENIMSKLEETKEELVEFQHEEEPKYGLDRC